jgi:phosphohistidine phosphatase SixA
MSSHKIWVVFTRSWWVIFILFLYACAPLELPEITPTPLASTATPDPTPTLTPLSPLPTSTPTAEPSPTIEPTPVVAAVTPGPLEGKDLVDALNHGGYIIFIRSAATDQPIDDVSALNPEDCKDQPKLNQEGRNEAQAIGEALRELNIPVGQVLSSELCHAQETAELAFGQYEMDPNLKAFSPGQEEQHVTALRQILSSPVQRGANLVLVSHGVNLASTTDLSIDNGEAAVFVPLEAEGYVLIARVKPDEWEELKKHVSPGQDKTALPPELSPTPIPEPTAESEQPETELLLPDLQTKPLDELAIRTNASTNQKLLRLTNSILNSGLGPLELHGVHNPETDKTIVTQYIYSQDGTIVEHEAGEFIYHPGHNHWHMENLARYELWSITEDGYIDELVGLTDKVSYCLRDSARVDVPGAVATQGYSKCDQEIQGISVGWVDIYKFNTAGQYVDITGLPDGLYELRSTADPENQIMELDDTNNTARVLIEIQGSQVKIIENPSLREHSPEKDERILP